MSTHNFDQTSETETLERELRATESVLKDALLQLSYVCAKLRARADSGDPKGAQELGRVLSRRDEITALWLELKRELGSMETERALAATLSKAAAAAEVMERLRERFERRAAERILERELSGL